jgi:hypothetical protein
MHAALAPCLRVLERLHSHPYVSPQAQRSALALLRNFGVLLRQAPHAALGETLRPCLGEPIDFLVAAAGAALGGEAGDEALFRFHVQVLGVSLGLAAQLGWVCDVREWMSRIVGCMCVCRSVCIYVRVCARHARALNRTRSVSYRVLCFLCHVDHPQVHDQLVSAGPRGRMRFDDRKRGHIVVSDCVGGRAPGCLRAPEVNGGIDDEAVMNGSNPTTPHNIVLTCRHCVFGRMPTVQSAGERRAAARRRTHGERHGAVAGHRGALPPADAEPRRRRYAPAAQLHGRLLGVRVQRVAVPRPPLQPRAGVRWVWVLASRSP